MDKKTRVGMDISQIAHKGGVATYTQNLAEALNGRDDLDMVYFYSSLRKPYKGNLKNVKKFKLPPTLFEILFNKLRNVPIEKFIGDIDVFHSSDWIQPKTKAKKVTTYHDLIPLKYPEWSHPKIVEVNKRRLKIVESEVDLVIAVSNSTKKDLIEISKIPEEKIIVIYEGVDESFKPQKEEDIKSFKLKYKLPEDLILSFGGVGERKNLKRVKDVSMGYNLVVAGESIPYLSEKELPLLFGSARVLFYPSLYEGFGLPILEAMACGTVVVTSNTSSLPEIGGRAPLYVDPKDIDDMKSKLKISMEDNEWRKKAIKEGLERVKEFSWKKCAIETESVYKSLI